MKRLTPTLLALLLGCLIGALYRGDLVPSTYAQSGAPSWAWADGASTNVLGGIDANVLAGKAPPGATPRGHRIDNLRLSIKPDADVKSVTEMEVTLSSADPSGKRTSIGTLDRRFVRPVLKDEALLYEYAFPGGLAVPALFRVDVKLGFNAKVHASANGARL